MSYLDILMSRGRQGTLFDQLAYRKMVGGGGGGTLIGTDTDPYLYRSSPSLGDYKTERDEIVGVSVGFNQLVDTTDTSVTVPSGHKYIAKISGTWSVGTSNGTALTVDGSNNDMVIDLTAMLGSTIADYIVTQGNTNGVAFFRKYFGADYYPYCSGSIRSVEGLVSHDMVGFNQWDEEWEFGNIDDATGDNVNDGVTSFWRSKNYIPVVEGLQYNHFTDGYNGTFRHFFYDENKSWITTNAPTASNNNAVFTVPANARYMRFRYYTNLTNYENCINISDADLNGQYKPYEKHSYPLDSTVTLRGHLILDNGKLKAEGDVYKASGEVVRNWGERAYQSGDESLADAITDGTTTVYKLTTPTTDTAQPFAKTQKVSPSGTEEYVSTGVVPVGHNTEYYG